MIKFRQFIVEAKKKKKKKLTPHEKKHGVATHFSHSDNRKDAHTEKYGVPTQFGHGHSKKDLKEQFSFDPPPAIKPKTEVVADHIKRTKPNEHLFSDKTKTMEGDKWASHSDRVNMEMTHRYNFHKTPHLYDVKEYTSTSSDINKGLYDAHVAGHHHTDMSHKDIEHWGDTIKNLDKATTHHTLTHPLTVYSGVTKRVPEDAAKHPERKVYHPGFVSTSLNAHVASNFTKPSLGQDNVGEHHILRIHLKPGHKMLHIGKNSNFPDEHEVLLPRGHTFKISDKPAETHDIQHQWNSSKKEERLHIWDAHVEHTLEDHK